MINKPLTENQYQYGEEPSFLFKILHSLCEIARRTIMKKFILIGLGALALGLGALALFRKPGAVEIPNTDVKGWEIGTRRRLI